MDLLPKNIIYEFGDFRLNARARKLTGRTGATIPLTPRVFDLLLLLIESGGRTVTKDELLKTVWAGLTVEEGNLTQSVFLLRKALGETSRDSHLIMTVPKQGYRFVADVNEIRAEQDGFSTAKTLTLEQRDSPPKVFRLVPDHEPKISNNQSDVKTDKFPMRSPARFAWLTALIAVLCVFVVIGFYWRTPSQAVSSAPEAALPIKTLAVLPFVWHDAPPDRMLFAEGLTENLINNLSRSPHLRVISYQAVSKYKHGTNDPAKIARELNVDALITGYIVNQNGDQVQIKIEIDRARDQTQLWGRIYTARLPELSSVQHRIAQDVAAQSYHLQVLEVEKDFALANYYLCEIYEQQNSHEAAVLYWKKPMFSDGLKAPRVAVLEQAFIENGYRGFAQAKL